MSDSASDQEDYLALTRREHRENPEAFFVEILQNLWGSRDEAQTLWEWNRLCTEVRWWAEDALECLDGVVADPPADLAELMQNEGHIMLDHDPSPYTVLWRYRGLYLEWLATIIGRFREIFDDTGSG